MSAQQYATIPRHPPADDERAAGRRRQEASNRARGLTVGQRTAVQTAMAVFAEDDLARGVLPGDVEYCPACDDARPLPGFVRYDDASTSAFVCNRCATEYEVARMQGVVSDIGEFLRGPSDG